MRTTCSRILKTVLWSWFLLLNPVTVRSQTVSLGLSAGIPVSPLMAVSAGYGSSTGRYTFGPALRVGLWRGFGFDAELLYKRYTFGFEPEPERAVVHRIDVPVLLRYSFAKLPARPWLHAGMSFNHVLAVNGANICAQGPFGEQVYCIGGVTAAELRHKRTHGPVIGGGIELGWGRIRMAPELRLTRWVDRNFGPRDAALRSNLTQVELLVGLSF